MRSSVVCEESKCLPMSGRATFATDRFRLATPATMINAASTRPARSGALEVSSGECPAVAAVTALGADALTLGRGVPLVLRAASSGWDEPFAQTLIRPDRGDRQHLRARPLLGVHPLGVTEDRAAVRSVVGWWALQATRTTRGHASSSSEAASVGSAP